MYSYEAIQMSFTNTTLGNTQKSTYCINPVGIKFETYAKLSCNALIGKKSRKVIVLGVKIMVMSGGREGQHLDRGTEQLPDC